MLRCTPGCMPLGLVMQGQMTVMAPAVGCGSAQPTRAAADAEQQQQQRQQQQQQQQSAPPSALLHLPEQLLVEHVWCHLGPWSRAQLRATCRTLKQLADAHSPSEVRTVLTRTCTGWAWAWACLPAIKPRRSKAGPFTAKGRQPDAAGHHGVPLPDHTTAARHGGLAGLCSLLATRTAPGAAPVDSLRLVLQWPTAHDVTTATLDALDVLLALGAATRHTLQSLSLYASQEVQLNVGLLDVVADTWPDLQELRIESPMLVGLEVEWAVALLKLPSNLRVLHLDTHDTELSTNWCPGVAHYLTRTLHTLSVMGTALLPLFAQIDPPTPQPLSQPSASSSAAAGCAAPGYVATGSAGSGSEAAPGLRHLAFTFCALDDAEGVVPLLRSCPHLTHLTLSAVPGMGWTPGPVPPIVQMLRCCPNLQSLELTAPAIHPLSMLTLHIPGAWCDELARLLNRLKHLAAPFELIYQLQRHLGSGSEAEQEEDVMQIMGISTRSRHGLVTSPSAHSILGNLSQLELVEWPAAHVQDIASVLPMLSGNCRVVVSDTCDGLGVHLWCQDPEVSSLSHALDALHALAAHPGGIHMRPATYRVGCGLFWLFGFPPARARFAAVCAAERVTRLDTQFVALIDVCGRFMDTTEADVAAAVTATAVAMPVAASGGSTGVSTAAVLESFAAGNSSGSSGSSGASSSTVGMQLQAEMAAAAGASHAGESADPDDLTTTAVSTAGHDTLLVDSTPAAATGAVPTITLPLYDISSNEISAPPSMPVPPPPLPPPPLPLPAPPPPPTISSLLRRSFTGGERMAGVAGLAETRVALAAFLRSLRGLWLGEEVLEACVKEDVWMLEVRTTQSLLAARRQTQTLARDPQLLPRPSAQGLEARRAQRGSGPLAKLLSCFGGAATASLSQAAGVQGLRPQVVVEGGGASTSAEHGVMARMLAAPGVPTSGAASGGPASGAGVVDLTMRPPVSWLQRAVDHMEVLVVPCGVRQRQSLRALRQLLAAWWFRGVHTLVIEMHNDASKHAHDAAPLIAGILQVAEERAARAACGTQCGAGGRCTGAEASNRNCRCSIAGHAASSSKLEEGARPPSALSVCLALPEPYCGTRARKMLTYLRACVRDPDTVQLLH